MVMHQLRGALLLVAALLPCIDLAIAGSSFLQSDSKDARALPGPPVDSAVVMRGIDELALSQNAMLHAGESQRYAKASQEEFLAEQALDGTHPPWESVRGMVPEANAQVLKVRKYAMLAKQHRDHTQLVDTEWRQIPAEASEEAKKAVLGWIHADAVKTAEHSATVDNRADRLAAAVAAAAEPYHLELLRNQKFCEETYSKAKTAQHSSTQLITKAKALAVQAQPLQASNLGLQARAMFATASGMMTEAENLRAWGVKLYNQANTACASTAGWTGAEQMAAANAAATTIINAPMKLPEKL